MVKFIKNLIQFFLVSYFVLTIFRGVELPSSIIHTAVSLIFLSLGTIVASSIIKFLTIKENFITFFLMSSLLSAGILFLLNTFMTDFYINEYTFEGLEMGSLIVNSFEVSPILTIVFCAISSSFIASILRTLEKSA